MEEERLYDVYALDEDIELLEGIIKIKGKEYIHQEIVSREETIEDYIDDDKEVNKNYIGELKEEKQHWKDIERIIEGKNNEELYMNWWKYGLYE